MEEIEVDESTTLLRIKNTENSRISLSLDLEEIKGESVQESKLHRSLKASKILRIYNLEHSVDDTARKILQFLGNIEFSYKNYQDQLKELYIGFDTERACEEALRKLHKVQVNGNRILCHYLHRGTICPENRFFALLTRMRSCNLSSIYEIYGSGGEIHSIIEENPLRMEEGSLDWKSILIERDDDIFKNEVFKGGILILKDAIPAILIQIFGASGIDLMSIYFLGQLEDKKYIAAGGLANSLYILLFFTLIEGLAGSIDTLCGQSYGSGNYYMVGIYMNRGRIIYFILTIPSIILMIFSQSILTSLSVDDKIASLTAEYLQVLIPAVLFATQYQVVKRYLQAQIIFILPMIIALINFLIYPFLCYLLAFYLRLGMLGIAYATSIANGFQLILITASIYIERADFSLEGKFLRCQNGPGVLIITIYNVIYDFPYGVASVAAPYVANSIANINIFLAKTYALCSIIVNYIFVIIIVILMIIFQNYIGRLFTKDKNVLKDMNILIIMSTGMLFTESLLNILAGIIRGIGLQHLIVLPNLFVYYPIMQPLALLLMFTSGLGVKGLLLALIIANTIISVCYIYVIYRLDWSFCAIQARNLIVAEHTSIVLSLLKNKSKTLDMLL